MHAYDPLPPPHHQPARAVGWSRCRQQSRAGESYWNILATTRLRAYLRLLTCTYAHMHAHRCKFVYFIFTLTHNRQHVYVLLYVQAHLHTCICPMHIPVDMYTILTRIHTPTYMRTCTPKYVPYTYWCICVYCVCRYVYLYIYLPTRLHGYVATRLIMKVWGKLGLPTQKHLFVWLPSCLMDAAVKATVNDPL